MKRFFIIQILFLCLCSSASAASVKIEEVKSPGGITAWLVRDDNLPLITMRFAWKGGVEQDQPEKQGLSSLAAGLLMEGAGPYDSSEFKKQLANRSIQMDFSAGRDVVKGYLKTIRGERKDAFKFLRLALTQPRFDGDAIERARNQQSTEIRVMLGKSDWQARYALFSNLFPSHPYSMRSLGTATTLGNIGRDDITSFVSNRMAKDNLIVAVAGSISPHELSLALDEVFGSLAKKAKLTSVQDVSWPDNPETIIVRRNGEQASMLFALPAPRREDPDWYAAEIANYILGGGSFSSRLMQAVRDKEGMTYGIDTSLVAMNNGSMIIGSVDVDNLKAGSALDVVKEVWRDLYENGSKYEEVSAAKDYLMGHLPLTLTSTSAVADAMMDMQLQKLGIDYLDRRNMLMRQVSVDDVNRVLRRWFNPDAMTLVAVGEPEGIAYTKMQEQTQE
ncbi:MAG: pitrilysin family protein [Alphaproteobacteria bacterium]|nr:pitrilysin family protein [Alphaproteobacteria bacterium]